jgi:hypothetical protein
MKSKQDATLITLQPIFNSLFGYKDFELVLKNVPSDKIEIRKNSIRKTQFKNLGTNPSKTTLVEELKAYLHIFYIDKICLLNLKYFLFPCMITRY